MQQGKIIFIENISEKKEAFLQQLENLYSARGILVEFATDRGCRGFYTVSEALLRLLQRGVKKITAFSPALGEKYEVPIYWGI